MKYNLARRNWKGSTKCCFCEEDETIQHLFISCPLARLVSLIFHMSFNLAPPTNIMNMFGNWLNGANRKTKAQIRVGFASYVGLYEIIVTRKELLTFCRLSTKLLIGSICGSTFSRWSSGPINSRCNRLHGYIFNWGGYGILI
jgi:hypothetical protein